MNSKIVSAIDIGSSKITTLIAQVNIDSTEDAGVNIMGISAVEAKGIKKGQIVNIEEAVEATIESVEASERMAGYNLDHAFISIGGAHIASQNSKGVVAVSNPEGEISPDDVERVIEAARAISLPVSRQIIHVIPREFIVDGEAGVKDPIGMSGVRLEVDTHIVTASSPALKNLSRTVQEVGVSVDEVVFNGLASSFSCLTDTEKELGCSLVDIGSGTTSIVSFIDGALSYSGAIPIGARNVTNDLAIGLRVSLETAESVKRNLSKETKSKEGERRDAQIEIVEKGVNELKRVQKRTLTEGIIKPRLNEIFTMVKLELEKNNLINKIPSGLVLTGGGSLTYGIEESARRTIGLPVRVAKPGGVGGLTDDILTPEYSSSIGLILYGVMVEKTYGSVSQGGGISSKMRVPNKAFFGRIVETIKELLP